MFWKTLGMKTKFFIVLGACTLLTIIILISALNVQNCNHQNEIEKLQKEILAQTNYAIKKVDENTSKISTIKTEKSISKDEVAEEIAKQLKKNNLDAVYTSQVNGMLSIEKQLKGQTKPTQVVEHNTQTIITDPAIEAQCNTCLANARIKVPFEGQEGPVSVKGYTLTPYKLGAPGDYTLDIFLLKELSFNVVLAQDKKGNWTTFIHSEDFDATQIKSKISLKPFKTKWYSKFMFPISILLSKQLHVSTNIGMFYKFWPHFAIGIQGGLLFLNTAQSQYTWCLGIGAIITSGK